MGSRIVNIEGVIALIDPAQPAAETYFQGIEITLEHPGSS